MKLATVTSSLPELEELVPLLRDLYFEGSIELLCLVNSEQEAALNAIPAIHRRLREYAPQPLDREVRLKDKALVEAARNALLEERPDMVLWPTETFLKQALKATLKQTGIGEYQLGQDSETSLSRIVQNLITIDHSAQPIATGTVAAKEFLEPHWERLENQLKSPCLLQTTPQLLKECRSRLPDIEFHTEPSSDEYPCGLSLLEASFSEKPRETYRELTSLCASVLSLEPVNSPLAGARWNLCYGPYDNEFALAAPELDLRNELPEGHKTVIWDQRCGHAGPHAPPHPDGKYPAFFSHWPHPENDWTERYALPDGETLKIVFADSGNVAGSVLHHCHAVNSFTSSEAWAITGDPHPFIGPRTSNERVYFLSQNPDSAQIEKVLREADCVVFFEDDDEHSQAWPFPMADFLNDTPCVHLYIGYRVHARTPRLARPGRLILTPLPHLLRMYPGSSFYAGFPPHLDEAEESTEPLSAVDGVCRFLHTPSLPHWTTSRYPYHKDTEAYLEAARELKREFGKKVEFHQVGGWSHREVVRARQLCDVTFNQLRGFHGLSGDEAMMLGRPCVQSFDQFNINRHLEYWGLEVEFPWLTCGRDNLADTFRKLVNEPAFRTETGEASRRFMRKYFSPRKGILPLLFHCYRAVRGEVSV